MPTPLGHAMAGVAVAWVSDVIARHPLDHEGTKTQGNHEGTTAQINHEGTKARRLNGEPKPRVPTEGLYRRLGGGFTLTCAALAAAPDLDLLVHAHRTYAHSLGAVLVVGLLAAVVARRRRLPVARTAFTCGAAWGSHLLLDWLGADTTAPFGIMALWPFTDRWYMSGVSLFDSVSRRYGLPWQFVQFVWGNLMNAGWEVLVLAPVLAAIWLIRVKALARLAPEVTGRHHPAQ